MSPSELQELKKLIVYVAEYYGRDLKPQTVAMMAQDLEDLPIEEVKAAFNDYRRNGKNDRFPLPGVIREKVRPVVTPKSNAIEAAARIIAAGSKFGYVDPVGARAFIGELGWLVVEMQGGWVRHCESEQPTGVIQAQYTKLAEALLERAASGDSAPPGLPGGMKVPAVGEIEQGTMTRIAALLGDRNGKEI